MIDGDARERVRRIVKEAAPFLSPGHAVLAAVLQMLNDGASAAQLEYVRGSPGARSPRAVLGRRRRNGRARVQYTGRGQGRFIEAAARREGGQAPFVVRGPALARAAAARGGGRRRRLRRAGAGGGRARKSDVPPEFRCAINGHLLKEPARTPQGRVFERATIGGSRRGVCLPPHGRGADARRSDRRPRPAPRIVPWQLAKTQRRSRRACGAHGDEDDRATTFCGPLVLVRLVPPLRAA